MRFKLIKPPVVTPNLYDRMLISLYIAQGEWDMAQDFAQIKPDVEYEIKEVSEKKTLTQVGYAWLLLGRMAEHNKDGLTKDDIYREYVRRFYKYKIEVFPSDIADKYMKLWVKQGTGWQCDVLNEYDGLKEIICYIGMSDWDRKDVTAFIDQIKEDCKDMRIPTAR